MTIVILSADKCHPALSSHFFIFESSFLISAHKNTYINEFQSAHWAKDRGMFAEVYETAEELDEAVAKMADYLLSTNPEAQKQLKKVFWEGTDHWDNLLEERAEKSGKLVLSEYTKAALAKYA